MIATQSQPAPASSTLDELRIGRFRPRPLHAPVRMHCTAAIGCFLATVILLTGALPSTLLYGFPALAFLVAVFLFTRSRTAYIGFVFALWYLSPFLRRLVEYRIGFTPNNPMLLAAFLATGVSGWLLLTRIRDLAQPAALPFSCALGAIAFGTVVGLTRYPALAVFQAVLNWVAPLCFAFFLYAERHRFREYQCVMEPSLLYGTLVGGAYGCYQFFFLPAWDRQWMVDLNSHPFGVPEPFQLRVFSTLNAPAVFAAYMMAGLLMLLALKGRLRVLAAPLAFLAFIFTTSRASWIGILFGFGYLATLLPNRARLRVASGALLCVVLLMAATQLPVVDEVVSSRLQSFTDPKKDVSFNERIDGHMLAFEKMLTEPMGEGMGALDTDHTTTGADATIGPHDSTILEALYALGFPGSLLYLVGIVACMVRIFTRTTPVTREPFAVSLRAIFVACLVQTVLNSIFVGVFGFLTWTVIGMALASSDLPTDPASHA